MTAPSSPEIDAASATVLLEDFAKSSTAYSCHSVYFTLLLLLSLISECPLAPPKN